MLLVGGIVAFLQLLHIQFKHYIILYYFVILYYIIITLNTDYITTTIKLYL